MHSSSGDQRQNTCGLKLLLFIVYIYSFKVICRISETYLTSHAKKKTFHELKLNGLLSLRHFLQMSPVKTPEVYWKHAFGSVLTGMKLYLQQRMKTPF